MPKLFDSHRAYLMVIMTLLSGQLFFSLPVFGATDSTITINLSVIPSLDLPPNSFGQVSQSVEVVSDNYTGCTVTLTNPSSDTNLVNSSDNTLTIPTITLPSGSDSITGDDFEYGYGVSLDATNFVPAPTDSTPLLIGSNTTAGTASYALTFGAKILLETVPGSYSKTFVVMAVAKNPQYSIDFNQNTADTVNDMPSDIATTISDTGSIVLPDNVPTRSGYLFQGWDENSSATTATYPVGSTNVLSLDPTQANAITLYAVWKIARPITYINLTDNDFPTVIADGSDLQITTIDAQISGFNITMGGATLVPNTDYTYSNNILTVFNVTDSLTIEAITHTADYTEIFPPDPSSPSASATTSLNLSVADYQTKTFEYINNSGRPISAVRMEIVYSKANNGGTTSQYITGKLIFNGVTHTGGQISVPKQKATNATLFIADFNNLNIPSDSGLSFTIDAIDSHFTSSITIVSQIVTITYGN